EEEDKKKMRKKEEYVLGNLGIKRETNKEEGEKELEKIEEIEKDNKEKTSNSNFLDAWKHAIDGIIYATTTQRNVKIQLVIAVAVVIISLFFDLSRAEFLCFLFTIILILFAEM